MKVIWTPKAVAGWQEVADYILNTFGVDAMIEFESRTYESEANIALMPNIGTIEWNDTIENRVYRYVTIHRRSKMLYYVENNEIYIADFWDVRKNK